MKTPQAKKAKIKFYKFQSEGNDFVIFGDAKAKKLKSSKTIKAICDRVTGVGADGIIFMNKTSAGWTWSFYNGDGSAADMCGNGAKCAALWLKTYGEPRKESWHWKSAIGPVESVMGTSQVMWVKWPIADSAPKKSVALELGEVLDGLNERGLAYLASIDTGVPHLVLINHEAWTSTDRGALNQQFRGHPVFGKAGIR